MPLIIKIRQKHAIMVIIKASKGRFMPNKFPEDLLKEAEYQIKSLDKDIYTLRKEASSSPSVGINRVNVIIKRAEELFKKIQTIDKELESRPRLEIWEERKQQLLDKYYNEIVPMLAKKPFPRVSLFFPEIQEIQDKLDKIKKSGAWEDDDFTKQWEKLGLLIKSKKIWEGSALSSREKWKTILTDFQTLSHDREQFFTKKIDSLVDRTEDLFTKAKTEKLTKIDVTELKSLKNETLAIKNQLKHSTSNDLLNFSREQEIKNTLSSLEEVNNVLINSNNTDYFVGLHNILLNGINSIIIASVEIQLTNTANAHNVEILGNDLEEMQKFIEKKHQILKLGEKVNKDYATFANENPFINKLNEAILNVNQLKNIYKNKEFKANLANLVKGKTQETKVKGTKNNGEKIKKKTNSIFMFFSRVTWRAPKPRKQSPNEKRPLRKK
jgi:hypothetical protein